MDEPPDESLNHENTTRTPDNEKNNIEGAGQALHRGSENAGVGSSEPTGDKVSGQANAGSRQTGRRTSEEAEQRSSQPTEHRLPGHAERKASQQGERRPSERRTSQPPNQQLPSLSERKASGKIDGQESLPSEQTGQETSELDDLIPSASDDYLSARSQQQEYNQHGYWTEDSSDPHRLSEDIEKDYTQVRQTTEKQAGYRSYYKTLAHIESRTLTDTNDYRETGQRLQPCTFEDSEAELPSKVSTTEETESATTIQAYNTQDTELTTSTSHEKLPSITTKVYYSSSPEKVQTTEYTSNIATVFDQGRSSQRSSQNSRRRFPPIVFEDPYHVALRYMEKHNILQIFQQITENLVYERPDDPLYFMLDQVQGMIKYRDERQSN
ncbi:testis-specific expressed protein 55 [Mus caroli]|uniref:Testis-specific expressed protein 55 n=1 Tax=Mus caroli TaxID=10089 RepID=A0A6P5RAG9_MUSCR|nr:testis-specific expressed protein 55 [Mus caroli]